jgi:uncharacterized membrane protein YfcA
MDISTFLILGLTGLMAGFLGGMVGVGGGIIMVPMMVFALGLSQKTAQGTSLAVMMIPLSIGVAVFNYYKQGQVNVWYAIVIACFFAVGGYFGSKLALSIDQTIVKKIFAVLMVLIAIKMFFGK